MKRGVCFWLLCTIGKFKAFGVVIFRSVFMHLLLYLGGEHRRGHISLRWNVWSRAMMLSMAVGVFSATGARRCIHDHAFGTQVVEHQGQLRH
eukprot:COSAG06_NODE_482_length_15147_cov_9.932815_9_plen_92_part_00